MQKFYVTRDMKIPRLTTHALYVEGDHLTKTPKIIIRLGLGTMNIISRNQVVEIAHIVS